MNSRCIRSKWKIYIRNYNKYNTTVFPKSGVIAALFFCVACQRCWLAAQQNKADDWRKGTQQYAMNATLYNEWKNNEQRNNISCTTRLPPPPLKQPTLKKGILPHQGQWWSLIKNRNSIHFKTFDTTRSCGKTPIRSNIADMPEKTLTPVCLKRIWLIYYVIVWTWRFECSTCRSGSYCKKSLLFLWPRFVSPHHDFETK